MTPERQRQLNEYYTAMVLGGQPPSNIPLPTPQEAQEFGRAIDNATPPTSSGRPSRGTSTTSGTSNRVSNMRTGTSEGQPIDVAHSNRVSNIRGTGKPATTGTSTRGSSTPSTLPNEEATTDAPRERSAWSEFLHQAMEEAGGDPRAMRIPFEHHPRQVFDRYQNVAQPGFGRPVQSTMPGQSPGGTPPSQRGPMPRAMQDPRMQQMSPTMAPDSRTMGNFNTAMQRVQPMMGQQMPRPRPEPRFSAQPMPMPSRQYSPPPSYRGREPNEAEQMMGRFRSTGSMY